MKVRAKSMGYYRDRRQKEGAVFFLKKAEDFSEKWMEKVDGEKEEKKEPKKPSRAKKPAPKADEEVI